MVKENQHEISFLSSVRDRGTIKTTTAEVILNRIKESTELMESTDEYRKKIVGKSVAEISGLKASLFSVVIFSGTFGGTAKDVDIEKMNGLIVLDYDHLEDREEFREKLEENPLVYACFNSPTGAGVKVLVKHNLTDPTKWKGLFQELDKTFTGLLSVHADPSGKNISRMCFVPYDPSMYLSDISHVYEYKGVVEQRVEKLKTFSANQTPFKKTEISDELYKECFYKSVWLKENNVNIVEDYNDWTSFGFSLATFGEKGREIFHNLSSVSPKYNDGDCNKKFDNFLKDFDGKRSGVEKYINVVNKEIEITLEEKINKNDYFPDYDFYNRFPETLTNPVRLLSNKKQKFMGLLSGLAVTSAVLPKYKTWHYDRWYHANLFVWIAAGTSMGKNIIQRTGDLPKMIQDEMTRTYKKEMRQWLWDKEDAKRNEQTFVKRPPKKHAIKFGADATKAGIVKFIEKNKHALMVTTEAKTLVGSNKSRFGDFVDLLLLCFEHETIIKTLKDEEFEIERPQMSLSLASTKDLIYEFFASDNMENGLFNRFLCFEVVGDGIDDEYSQKNIDQSMKQIEEDLHVETQGALKTMRDNLTALHSDVIFELSDEQNKQFDEFFTDLTRKFLYIYNLDATLIRRMAVNFKKILMIISIIREYEKYNTLQNFGFTFEKKVTATAEDFESVKELFRVYETSFVKLLDGIKKYSYRNVPVSRRDDIITTMHYEGEKTYKIAKYFEMPIKKVQEIINKYAGKKVNGELVRILSTCGKTTIEIAQLLNVSQRYIQIILKDK